MKTVGWAVLLLLAAVVGGVLWSAVVNAGAPVARVVEAEEFRLVDSAGKVRASLSITEEGPALTLFDARGKTRARLDELRLALYDAKGEPLAGLGLDMIENQEPVPLLPMLGDETPLTRVEANTRDYIGKAFILVGRLAVDNLYLSAYRDARDTHVCFRFDEVRSDRTRTRKNITLYLRRNISAPLVDAFAYGGKLVRAKVTFLRDRYADSVILQAELLDWQFLDKDGKTWGPWAAASK